MSPKKWPEVEKALRRLGVLREMMWRVEETRSHLVEISSMGMSLLPDFTLHNHVHSDSIIFLLDRLRDEFKFRLNEHEAYLLATSAYLHDLGMFFDEERFRHEILPNLVQALPACYNNCCDHIETYDIKDKKTGEQIREVHNLLSASMLRDGSIARGVIDPDDLPYIIAVCRGHRKANLRAQGCTCYRNEPLKGNVIHTGLLAALLRLVDALDFYRDRAPSLVFEHRARKFLNDPVALEHWLKHFFVTDSHVTRQDQSGNISLVCTVNFRVPVKQINGESYLSFFRPLFEKHVTEANEENLDINRYPSVFTETLHITTMQVELNGHELDGSRELPEDITSRIKESECKSVLDFLQWLQQDIGHSMLAPRPSRKPVMKAPPFYLGKIDQGHTEHFYNRSTEIHNALELLCQSENVEVAGPSGIGKTWFLHYISYPATHRDYDMDFQHDLFVYINCQHRSIQREESQVYKRMSECIMGAARDSGASLVSSRSYEGPAAGTAFEQTVKEISGRGIRTILLLDEFEVMAHNRRLDVSFFNHLRALYGADGVDIAYVTASRVGLIDLCLGRQSLLSSPFFNIFRPIRLGLFSEQASRYLVEDSLRRAGARFPKDLLELVVEVGGGHPLFLQMAGHYAFSLLGPDGKWTEEKQRAFEEIASEDAIRYFRFYWQKLGGEEMSVLAALPLVGEDSSRQEEIEHLRDQCLIAWRDNKYDYFSPLFEKFVRHQKVSGSL